MSVNTTSQGMGGKSPVVEPPKPQDGSRILQWATSFWTWAKRSRPIPGDGLIGRQTPGGFLLSAVDHSAPVGTVLETYADIYGDISDPTRAAAILSDLRVAGWIPCDGSTKNVDDFPRLAYFLGYDLSDTTFVLPDRRGRVGMGADPRGGSVPAHSDSTYTVGAVGGYRRHGQTENNHHDHRFSVDLEHTHPITLNSAEVCLDVPVAGVCAVGSPTNVVIPTGSGTDTGDPVYPATGDDVPTGEGSINRDANEVVTVVLKHYGDDGDGTVTDPGDGNRLDDADNRPPYIVANYIIKAF